MELSAQYPVSLTIDYPDRPLNRVTTFFRIFALIPIVIVMSLLIGGGGEEARVSAVGFVVLPTLLLILFRRKYPKWWYDWNYNLTHFMARVGAYASLLTDEYPSTDEEQFVHLQLPYPDAQNGLNRWLPLVKWFLAIPHYIILAFLSLAALVAVMVAWFIILFTGRLPKGLFDFVVGVFRWHLRVIAYAILLVTDQYPPFSLEV